MNSWIRNMLKWATENKWRNWISHVFIAALWAVPLAFLNAPVWLVVGSGYAYTGREWSQIEESWRVNGKDKSLLEWIRSENWIDHIADVVAPWLAVGIALLIRSMGS